MVADSDRRSCANPQVSRSCPTVIARWGGGEGHTSRLSVSTWPDAVLYLT